MQPDRAAQRDFLSPLALAVGSQAIEPRNIYRRFPSSTKVRWGMAEVEEWLRFTDVFSAWLALIDESYVNELKLCRGYATEINQSTLAPAIAARSAKVFYYLQQCFAKWDRGLELLRSVSKRQGSTAAGYETMRFIHANYSIISRMEAVHVRA